MSSGFTILALAIAAERANAIGVVRLTCLPEGLEIELVRAAAFAAGFAPPSVAEEVSFTVPYTAVRGLVRSGRALSLALDPAVATPHNRFVLVRFSDDAASTLALTYRARLFARALSYVLPAPAGVAAALLVPRGLVGGALGTASLAVIVGALVWAALEGVVRWINWGGPASDQRRDAFERELSRRLGLLPATANVSPKNIAPSPWDEGAPRDRRLLVAAVVAAATFGLVGVMAFLKRFVAPPPEAARAAAAEIAVGLGNVPTILSRIEIPPPTDDRPRCSCQRADSPLWSGGVPALSVLLFSRPDDGSGVVAPIVPEAESGAAPAPAERPRGRRRKKSKKGPRFDFDLAVVNNTAAPMRDVRVVLTFARRDKDGQRVGVTDRGLFWGGELAPGRAVKWHVRAPGTEMRVETSEPGVIREGDGGAPPAPPEAFQQLLSSRYRVVKIHAAKMLAYLRDPRAEAALSSLGGASTLEAPVITQIQRASGTILVCDVASAEGRIEACVFNADSKPAPGVVLREAPKPGADPGGPSASSGPAARAFPLEGSIPIHEGIRVSFPLEGPSDGIELFAERAPPPAPPAPPNIEPTEPAEPAEPTAPAPP